MACVDREPAVRTYEATAMWDLKKTMQGIEGARKREARGLPPFTSTPEEKAKWTKTCAKILAAKKARDATGDRRP